MDWTPIVVAAIPTAGALAATWVAVRDIGLRRDVGASQQFAQFVAAAHGRPIDGRDRLGLGEQLAYIELVVSLAKRHRRLRPAAMAALGELAQWDGSREKDEVSRVAARGLTALERRP